MRTYKNLVAVLPCVRFSEFMVKRRGNVDVGCRANSVIGN